MSRVLKESNESRFFKRVSESIDLFLRIIGSVAVPPVLGYLTYEGIRRSNSTLLRTNYKINAQQEARQKEQSRTEVDLKLLDIFYREVKSADSQQHGCG